MFGSHRSSARRTRNGTHVCRRSGGGLCVDKDDNLYVAEVISQAKESPPPKDLHPALQKFKLR